MYTYCNNDENMLTKVYTDGLTREGTWNDAFDENVKLKERAKLAEERYKDFVEAVGFSRNAEEAGIVTHEDMIECIIEMQ